MYWLLIVIFTGLKHPTDTLQVSDLLGISWVRTSLHDPGDQSEGSLRKRQAEMVSNSAVSSFKQEPILWQPKTASHVLSACLNNGGSSLAFHQHALKTCVQSQNADHSKAKSSKKQKNILKALCAALSWLGSPVFEVSSWLPRSCACANRKKLLLAATINVGMRYGHRSGTSLISIKLVLYMVQDSMGVMH
jgi:hypothetical protein